MIDETFVTEIAALEAASAKIVPVPDVEDVVMLPVGRQLTDVRQYAGAPRRVEAAPRFIKRESFTGYANRFKSDVSIIEGSLRENLFTARLDYHYTPEQSGGVNATPQWNSHNPKLVLKQTAEFGKLLACNDKGMTQEKFAEFIEDLSHIVIEPDSATLVEMAMKFEATSTMRFESKANRQDGSLSFVYKDEKNVVGQLKVPEVIGFHVPVYESSEAQTLAAQLRYRISDGSLIWFYVIQQIDKIKRDAFDSVAEAIKQETELPVYITE